MQKFSVRNGIMLLCGRLPPAGEIVWNAMGCKFAAAVYAVPPLERAMTVVGSGVPAFAGGGVPFAWTV